MTKRTEKKPLSQSSADISRESKKPWGSQIGLVDDILTLRFPTKRSLGWKDKPKKEEQWETLIEETCVFEFPLGEPIIGIVDDYEEDTVYINNAFDLTRGDTVDGGSIGLNMEAIKKVHVLENWYVYEAKCAAKRVQEEGLDKLPNEFTAWHARCISKLSPHIDEGSLAEAVCMLEDDIDMDIQDGTAYKKEKESASPEVSITEPQAAELAEAVKKIGKFYEERKITEDYAGMLAGSIRRIAELIGVTATQESRVDKVLKGDRDLYELAMMFNDFLRDTLEINEEEEKESP